MMTGFSTFQSVCGLAGVKALTPEKVQEVEAMMLGLEQMDGPVIHRFGAGVYIREIFVKAGAFIIGHHHKREHMNVMLSGRVSRLMEDGSVVEYVAPLTFLEPPGRKIGIVHEDMRWQNIFVTNETDVAKLEAELFDKSAAWTANQAAIIKFQSERHEADREDFLRAITELGFSEKTVREQSENEADQIPMPPGDCKFLIAPSPIEGRGVFVTCDVEAGEVIAVARIGGMRTPVGRYTNHSMFPNAEMAVLFNGDLALVAIKPLNGCLGGNPGDEVTLDYRQAFAANRNQFLQQEQACRPLLQSR